MEHLQWIFSGIGTELFSLVIGAIVGGVAGYKVGIKKSGKQTQKAKSRAKQKQEMIIDSNKTDRGACNTQNRIRQVQRAGKNSEQEQIGRITDGKQ